MPVSVWPAVALVLAVALVWSCWLAIRRGRRARLFETVIDGVPYPIFIKTAEGRYLHANPAAGTAMGVTSVQAMLGRTDIEVLGADGQAIAAEDRSVLDTGEPITVPRPLPVAGRMVRFASTKRRIDVAGYGPLVMGSAADMTDFLRLSDAMRAERALRDGIFDTSGAVMVVLDRQGTVVAVNHAFTTLTGWSAEELIGQPIWASVVPPERRDTVRLGLTLMAPSELPVRRDAEWMRRDGSRVWISWSNVCTVDANGAIDHFISTGIDLSERLVVERSLRESEARYREVWEKSSDMLSVMSLADDDLWLIDMNPATERATGLTREHCGRRFVEYMSADTIANGIAHCRRCLAAGAAVSYVETMDLPAGSRTLHVTLVPLQESTGPGSRILGITHDLTEIMRKEAARRAGERDAAIGRMATRVAHEVNNPLEAIKVFIEPLRARVGDRPEVDQALVIIDQQVDRIARLVKTMTGYARERKLSRAMVHLHHALDPIVALFQPRFAKEHKRLASRPCDQAMLVDIDVDGVQQVLINLLENALAASPEHGEVLVETRLEGGQAEIHVSDSGCGLGRDPERLFQPFVTTKSEGTGLGLAVARRICEAHGGRLVGRDRSAGGALFVATLPLPEAEASVTAGPAALT